MDLLDRYLDYVKSKGVTLYPAQEEAILELFAGKNLILNTPTGSGKSLVAAAVQFKALHEKKRSVYTSPIKALVNEKFLSLCRDFGPENVGMITGDASVNPNASIICCTAEILAIDALRMGSAAPVDEVIMDEFHYYSDRERGSAWQIPLLTLPQARFLLMSATLGDVTRFEEGLTWLNGRETVVVRSVERPVPLDYRYSEKSLGTTIEELVTQGRAPIYLVCFTQRDCAEEAQNLLSTDFSTKEEKRKISEELIGADFSSPYGKELQRLLKHGVGLHHAGLLPRYRLLVESLAQKGLLKIICGTDTLGVGVNVPIRTVLFTKLCKFDGEKTALLSVRDFHQISGRAGRKGFDQLGTVVAQAPEHVVENLKMEQKAAADPKKAKKFVKKKPPEKGYVAWSKETFEKLIHGKPEALTSRFQMTHATLLNVLSRGPEGCDVLRNLIRNSHESENMKRSHRKVGFSLFRSLVDRKIIELNPMRLNVDLQQDFSLNQGLSLFLVDTLKLIDPQSPDYALDLLTLVESILENPEVILRKQLDRVKGEKIQELKEAGMDYEERMLELEKLEYPKPNRDFIYDHFNVFAAAHPWVGQENIRPKSIAREMYQNFQSFAEYIRDYELQRSEGLLLRYLSDVYKTLVQNVPDYDKSDELFSMEEYFLSLLKSVDSSLIDEWEKLRNPSAPVTRSIAPELRLTQAQEKRKLVIQLRNEVFRIVRALSRQDFEEAHRRMVNAPTPDALAQLLEPYWTAHSSILTNTEGRANQHLRIQETPETWVLEQTLVDREGDLDWQLVLEWDSKATGAPQFTFRSLGTIGNV